MMTLQGWFWNMLLVSAFLHLGRTNSMKHSTHDDTTRVVLEHVSCFYVTIFGKFERMKMLYIEKVFFNIYSFK